MAAHPFHEEQVHTYRCLTATPRPGPTPYPILTTPDQPFLDGQFDIFDWYPSFQSCVRYFLEHAQYNGPVQALAAFINIQLPFQKAASHNQPLPPVIGGGPGGGPGPGPGGRHSPATAANPYHHPPAHAHASTTSLQPYIRRLVATGFDHPAVLHGFFGDDWERGVRPLHEQERRNYLFAAKSSSWLEVKRAYDHVGGAGDEPVPFLKPLKNVSEGEIVAAEAGWSEWLAMQDW
jgi:hypothetical protein